MAERVNEYRRMRGIPKPSFLTGVARIMDVFGTFNDYETLLKDLSDDKAALRSDWKAVGDMLRFSMQEFENSEEYKAALQKYLAEQKKQQNHLASHKTH